MTRRGTSSAGVGRAEATSAAPHRSDPRGRVHRFPVSERILHWTIAFTGIICILTGLGWFADPFRVLLGLFGGGTAARWIHGLAGIAMTACAVALFGVIWSRRVFRFRPEDREWLRVLGGYLRRRDDPAPDDGTPDDDVPDQGFFNAGQKLWGILALILAALFFLTGLMIWTPEIWHDALGLQPLSVGWMRAAYIVHDLSFVLFTPMVILHIYLSSALNPGTFEAMTRGDVSREWAIHHHRLWYRDAMDRSEED